MRMQLTAISGDDENAEQTRHALLAKMLKGVVESYARQTGQNKVQVIQEMMPKLFQDKL